MTLWLFVATDGSKGEVRDTMITRKRKRVRSGGGRTRRAERKWVLLIKRSYYMTAFSVYILTFAFQSHHRGEGLILYNGL